MFTFYAAFSQNERTRRNVDDGDAGGVSSYAGFSQNGRSKWRHALHPML